MSSSQADDKLSGTWARNKKKELAYIFCSPDLIPPTERPVTIFMAGTPGAGKTEFSKSLLELFNTSAVRIDADDIRDMMKEIGYNGANSEKYQYGVGLAVNNLYRKAIKQHQSVLIDGTFAYRGWRENIEMSLHVNRLVEIYYLYQDPKIAWDFVKKRELSQGRAVPIEVFVKDYTDCIENVCNAKELF
ncbi:MAG TPA: zeta toxin family protein [Candidatus Dormibacteraeota bacterium]|nr:zeta toxin family protein [Candidatus Dormibacteraeota bacterium]